MKAHHTKAISLAFSDGGPGNVKLSLVIRMDGPIEPDANGAACVYVELTDNQIRLLLREYVLYMERSERESAEKK